MNRVILNIKPFINRVLYLNWEKKLRKESSIINRKLLEENFNPTYYSTTERLTFPDLTHQFVPHIFKEKFSWIKEYKKDYQIPKPFYVTVRNAEVRGKRALVFDQRNNTILESIGDSKGYLLKSGDIKQAQFPKLYPVQKKLPSAFSLVDSLSRNYYHWVNDVLPLLEAYKHYCLKTGDKPTIIIDQNPPSFQREYLSLLGFEEDCILEWKYDRIKVETMLIATRRYLKVPLDGFWARTHILSRNAFSWLRTQLSSNSISSERKKIYISRSDAGSRRVSNEEELLQVLLPAGFEPVTLNSLSVGEQIKLFSAAQCVVTVHGAGLLNTIFSNKLKVIELFPKNRYTESTSTYYQIAHFFGHQYRVVACESINAQEDICVPVKLVAELIT